MLDEPAVARQQVVQRVEEARLAARVGIEDAVVDQVAKAAVLALQGRK